ncbi:hypothetical protein SH501x_000500 [Pirellulaceae bacterium SH501]
MDLQRLQKQFIERLEAASGKPVILQSDPKFAGHPTIKIATKDQPAHVLLDKPEQESVLPYLVAYSPEDQRTTEHAEHTEISSLPSLVSVPCHES